MGPTVRAGIIANPASGKDIRRLVAYGSIFDNEEKVGIFRRILLGIDSGRTDSGGVESGGVDEILIMPDTYGIGERALDGLGRKGLAARVRFLDMDIGRGAADSTMAADIMCSEGCGSIVVLGGDGTCRAVAKGCGPVPLVAVSTGTNNVFPAMVEGTTAGLAAAAVARGLAPGCYRAKSIILYVNGRPADLALVDIVITTDAFLGARALWDMSRVKHIVCSMGEPTAIGLSAVAGCLEPVGRREPAGLHLEVSGHPSGSRVAVRAPICPGVIQEVHIEGYSKIAPGERVSLGRGPCAVALDGERDHLAGEGDLLEAELSLEGPLVVDVAKALAEAQKAGMFRIG
ncbi:MAG: NAD(+)/NADH kinase [Ignavibacteriales bacterium]